MSDSEIDEFEWDHTLESPHANQINIDAKHTIVKDYDGTEAVSIYCPSDAPHGQTSEWIAAIGDESFVAAEEVR